MNTRGPFRGFAVALVVSTIAVFQQAGAQSTDSKQVIITGVRFAYPLVQKWIDEYRQVNPEADVRIDPRGSSDPANYDILIEAYPQPDSIVDSRRYIHIARYAILPIANSKSKFANVYIHKGLTNALIKQLYFHDIFTQKEDQETIRLPYTVYTRLQPAASPFTFAQYFGYQQNDIQGRAIAGADTHLIQGVLHDSTGISYGPLSLIYDMKTHQPLDGLSILPVDLDGNGRVTQDEHVFTSLDNVISYLESTNQKDIHNIPVEDIHLSIRKNNSNEAAIEFMSWVAVNGLKDLHPYGYLLPDDRRLQREQEEFDKAATVLKTSLR